MCTEQNSAFYSFIYNLSYIAYWARLVSIVTNGNLSNHTYVQVHPGNRQFFRKYRGISIFIRSNLWKQELGKQVSGLWREGGPLEWWAWVNYDLLPFSIAPFAFPGPANIKTDKQKKLDVMLIPTSIAQLFRIVTPYHYIHVWTPHVHRNQFWLQMYFFNSYTTIFVHTPLLYPFTTFPVFG